LFFPLKKIVDKINDYVLSLIPNNEREYCSAESIDKSDELLNPAFGLLPPEFLNSLQISGIPNHKLKLKVGTSIMLIRNLDQVDGLCNGTRLIITKLGSNVVEAEVITGPNTGNRTYIPKINMSPSESPWPFKLIRSQFPFIVSYAMTINKSQGQSLQHVGLYCHTQFLAIANYMLHFQELKENTDFIFLYMTMMVIPKILPLMLFTTKYLPIYKQVSFHLTIQLRCIFLFFVLFTFTHNTCIMYVVAFQNCYDDF